MNPRMGLLWAAGLLVGSALFGCGDVSTIPGPPDGDAGIQTPSGSPNEDLATSDPSPTPAEDVNQETPPEQPQAQSVGDVTVEIAGRAFEPGESESADGSISARVLNESEYTIDVTLRFISQETTVHLAYLRVMPETVTTVTSPKPASEVLLSGVDERGRAVPAARFVSGKDFDETTPAVYRFSVVDEEEATSEQPEPEQPPANDRVAVEVKPEPYFPPLLSMLEPASDVDLALGSALFVQWEDYAVRPGTTVTISLHPVGAREHDQHIQLTPAMGAALDGINDELVMVLEDIEEGVYEVVGRIDDGVSQMMAVAPGRVTVRLDEGNEAPVLAITAPLEVVELQAGSALFLSWEDEDADDNATVTFGLVASAQDGTVLAEYAMDSMFSEDPDGSADVAYWPLDHVIPGTYDLVGT
ncbi:MAG: hypothetical protein JSV78_01050, partial [Phycisphaerales bacterium]